MTAAVLSLQPTVFREGNKLYCLLEFSAAEKAMQASRPPMVISLLVDRSSSMRGQPLRSALQAVRMLSERLSAQDILSVIVYDRDANVLWGPAPVTDDGRRQLHDRLDNVMSGYLTNIGGAYVEGCRHVTSNQKEGCVSRVMLLTDGHPSYGICDARELAEMASFQRFRGVVTTAIGVGLSFDETMLTRISRAGGGSFHYVHKSEDIPAVFAHELAQLFDLATQDLTLHIEMAPSVSGLNVLHSYPSSPRGKTVEVAIGDLYHGASRRCLLEMQCSSFELDEQVLRLKLTGQGLPIQEHEITVPPLSSYIAEHHAVLGKEILLFASAKAQKEALQHFDKKEYPEAQALLSGVQSRLEAFLLKFPNELELRDHVRDISSLHRRIDRRQVDGDARKDIAYRTHRTMLSHPGIPSKRRED